MVNNSLLHYKVNQKELHLSPIEQLLVENKLKNVKKNEVVEWLLWIFLGRLGFHRFYMNKNYGLGIFLLNIFGWILTCTFIFAFIGIPLICAAWIWWLIDGFYINNWIKYNTDINKLNILHEYTHHNTRSIHKSLKESSTNDLSNAKHLSNHPKGKHFIHK